MLALLALVPIRPSRYDFPDLIALCSGRRDRISFLPVRFRPDHFAAVRYSFDRSRRTPSGRRRAVVLRSYFFGGSCFIFSREVQVFLASSLDSAAFAVCSFATHSFNAVS